MTLPACNETEQRLRALGATASAPQCHGVLCGLLAVGDADARETWLAETVGEEAPGAEIDELYETTLQQLDDPEFGLDLLLPGDDEADLAERTRALADWAGGFTFGVACAGRAPEDLPAEVAEFVRDAAEVAALTDGDEDEGDEADYAEVVEYLRAGTLLARTECRSGRGSDDADDAGDAEDAGGADDRDETLG
ncbi:UPF0149 family protein [Halofilum ochraceum]|uniref:UPF0149 family protein n=1 Tax=Halofilum ochraceum TaxID=1611323 RepID=UPI001113196B|nr:UPF0149 family protein [Halofilum ochraceum]